MIVQNNLSSGGGAKNKTLIKNTISAAEPTISLADKPKFEELAAGITQLNQLRLSQINNLNANITNLTNIRNNLQSQVNSLTTDKTNLQYQINNLNSTISSLTTQRNNLQNQVNNLNSSVSSLQSQLNNERSYTWNALKNYTGYSSSGNISDSALTAALKGMACIYFAHRWHDSNGFSPWTNVIYCYKHFRPRFIIFRICGTLAGQWIVLHNENTFWLTSTTGGPYSITINHFNTQYDFNYTVNWNDAKYINFTIHMYCFEAPLL